jgi:hypothetical protein
MAELADALDLGSLKQNCKKLHEVAEEPVYAAFSDCGEQGTARNSIEFQNQLTPELPYRRPFKLSKTQPQRFLHSLELIRLD